MSRPILSNTKVLYSILVHDLNPYYLIFLFYDKSLKSNPILSYFIYDKCLSLISTPKKHTKISIQFKKKINISIFQIYNYLLLLYECVVTFTSPHVRLVINMEISIYHITVCSTYNEILGGQEKFSL